MPYGYIWVVRLVLVMGKGGVGKTTLSAATALAATERHRRVLLVSTDAAHSLADALDCQLGGDPVAVTPGVDAVQLDGRHELERSWTAIAGYARELLGVAELGRLHADELLVVPGLDQLLALARLRALVASGDWDAIVVDCRAERRQSAPALAARRPGLVRGPPLRAPRRHPIAPAPNVGADLGGRRAE